MKSKSEWRQENNKVSCEKCIVSEANYTFHIHVSPFTIYGEQFFKNMEEVKKVIHAQALIGRPIDVSARKTMGFDCIKLIYG